MKKDFIESIGCGKIFGYLLIWFGGAGGCLALLYFKILNVESLFALLLPVLFFAFARIQYLEDLLKVVEKRMNGG